MKKHLTTTFSILALILFTAGVSQGQLKVPGSKITGIVVDQSDKPLDFATVILLNAPDSSIVMTAMTDLSGKFIFENIPAGSYRVSATMISYNSVSGNAFRIDTQNPSVDAGRFQLKMSSKALKEVTVVSSRPFVERKVDRLVVNVEGSSISAGSTALEVLQKAPGITVDQNDNIAMQGKQGVLVMLDGKQTYMSNADVANMLKGMPSTAIESIELITNPSARYDANGNSGIINIKTKKNKNAGTNGSLTAGAGVGENHRTNAGITLNHRNNKINAFGNYNYSFNKRNQQITINRINAGKDINTYFGQTGLSVRNNDYNNFKAGIDLFLNKNNTLGVMVNGYVNAGHEINDNRTRIGRSYTQHDSSVVAINDGLNKYRNLSYNLNYKSLLDTIGQELTVDADYSQYHGNDRMAYDNRFFNSSGDILRPADIIRNGTPAVIDIRAFKVDYVKPLSKTVKLEAGAKSSWVKTDNNFKFEQLQGDNWVNDSRRSNHFVYDENVNAAYVTINKQYKNTTLQTGLRAEQTNSNGNLITTGKEVERSYFDLFPSVFVTHSLAKNHDIGVSYSRRIDRPSYDALNPFEFFLDQYTYNQGNPFLKPQYTNNFELTYTYKKTFSIGFNYGLTKDVIVDVLLPDTARKALFQTNENLSKQINYGFTANTPVAVAKWWNSNNNLQVFYLGFRSADLRGQELNNGKVAFQLNSQHTFIINNDLTAELNGNYQSPLEYGTLKIQSQYGLDIGLSRSFLNKKANLKLGLTDIFNTRKQRISSAYDGLTYNLEQKHETRIGKVTFTYRFGKNEIKPARRRSTALDEEQRRIKN